MSWVHGRAVGRGDHVEAVGADGVGPVAVDADLQVGRRSCCRRGHGRRRTGPSGPRGCSAGCSTTVAPSASSRSRSASDTRQAKVASGKPAVGRGPGRVARLLEPAGRHQPVDLARGSCGCRAGGPGRSRRPGPSSGAAPATGRPARSAGGRGPGPGRRGDAQPHGAAGATRVRDHAPSSGVAPRSGCRDAGLTRSPGSAWRRVAPGQGRGDRLVERELGLPAEELARTGRRWRRRPPRHPAAAAPRSIGTSWPKTRSKAAISSRTVTPSPRADVDDRAGRVGPRPARRRTARPRARGPARGPRRGCSRGCRCRRGSGARCR